jgi:hypothetical protein
MTQGSGLDMRFGTSNVRSQNRASSLNTVSNELSKYKLDLMGVLEIRWNRGGTVPVLYYYKIKMV